VALRRALPLRRGRAAPGVGRRARLTAARDEGGDMNRIVAHFQDGRLMKGFTTDFLPTKDHFHMTLEEQSASAKPVEVRVPDLKAVFFVKSFAGDPQHQRTNDTAQAAAGRRLRVVFNAGEVMA